MVLSEKTQAEMEAGALALAKKQGQDTLPSGYMDALLRTQSRAALLHLWERKGLLQVETVISYAYEPVTNAPHKIVTMLYHVKNGPTFDDAQAALAGAAPSELLIANIALALQAMGEV
jgi:hypothetical protein